MEKLEKVILIDWIESERGWGSRPDGCSIHLNKEQSQEYIEDYWKGMPDSVPDEYSRPEDSKQVVVGKKLYSQIKESENGIRLWGYGVGDKNEVFEK